MTPIPDTYSKHGFTLKLLARRGNAAIYEQWKAGRLWAYEAVKIRVRAACQLHGKEQPATERLPSDEDFGVYGKTYSLSGGSPLEARKAAEAQIEAWAESTRRPVAS